MGYTQDTRIASVFSNLGTDALLVRSMRARETLFGPFHIELELVSETLEIDLAAMIGTSMTVQILFDGSTPRYLNGLVSAFSQEGVGDRIAYYRADLVPWISVLQYRTDCRIFQDKSVLDIAKEVFEQRGFRDFEDKTTGSYPSRVYTVQYRETDYDFVMRLLEEAGVGYYFRHEDKRHTLVLFDAPSGNTASDQGQATYRTAEDQDRPGLVTSWSSRRQLSTGAYALGDYDFERPNTDLAVATTTTRPVGGNDTLEVYEYPGDYSSIGDGESIVRVRMEAQECGGVQSSAKSSCEHFSPGTHFAMTGHYRSDQNTDHLLIRVEHELQQSIEGEAFIPASYENQFECIPYAVPWRPRVTRQRPLMKGVQTAVVVGPSGQEIYTDEHGRVKVWFHWDRTGIMNETSSCWIRVSQAWAGKAYGGFALPRIGQEVLVDFIEGDPDRPIVTGRVYNGEQKVPFALPANKTQTGLRTRSSPDGAAKSGNELRFEDKTGSEQVLLHAEKQLDVRVKASKFETVGESTHTVVEKDTFFHGKNERHVKVEGDDFTELAADQHVKISGKQAIEIVGSRSTSITGSVADQFKASYSGQVTGSYYVKAAGVVIEATAGITLKCGGSSVVIDPVGVTLKGAVVTVDGAMVKIASGPGSPPTAGTAGSLVPPTQPKLAQDADVPGQSEMAKIKARQAAEGRGRYGVTPPNTTPFTRAAQAAAAAANPNATFIEIELLDEDGQPVPGEQYEVTLPDGQTVASGTLDENGAARIEGIDPGQASVTFPNLDKDAWEPS